MGGLSIWHLLILLAVVVILFGGGGKLSRIMGDFGKGINSFKAGLKSEDEQRREEEEARAATIEHPRTVSGSTADGTVRKEDTVRR
jgi:sec-independent protein translocase protein TatA